MAAMNQQLAQGTSGGANMRDLKNHQNFKFSQSQLLDSANSGSQYFRI